MPQALVHRIPQNLSYELAALAEPMAITVHEVTERGRIDCQDTVVVTGSGPIGILAAFVAKSCGAARVYMTGMNSGEPVRFGVAEALGVDIIINVQKEDPVKKINELTGGKGADVIIETSGAGPAIFQSVDMVRTSGRITAIGLTDGRNVEFQWNKAMYKALDISFNFSSSYTSWDKALSLMGNTKMDLGKIITHKAPIAQWREVFEDIEAERGVKALFIPETNAKF